MLRLNYSTVPLGMSASDIEHCEGRRPRNRFSVDLDNTALYPETCPQCGRPMISDEPSRCLSCTWRRPAAERV